jgi:hypothetical protein
MIYYPNKPIKHETLVNQDDTTETNNNQGYLPAEIWENIVKFCDIKTTYILTTLCKFNYLLITPLLQRKIYQQVPNNCLSYSIDSYKTFIGPMLEDFDPETKLKIDEYLQNNKENKNIDNTFCNFIFQQLASTAKKLRTATGSVTQNLSNNIIKFKVNFKSNHCAIQFKDSMHLIKIYRIDYPINLTKLIDINCINDESIACLKFTPENNLLILLDNRIEKHSLRFVLYQLNLEGKNTTKKLWDCKIDHIEGYKTYKLSLNKAIMFPCSNDKKLLLIKDYKPYLIKVGDSSSYNIENFIIPYIPHKSPIYGNKVSTFIFSANGLELAAIVGYYPNKSLHLFSRSNNEENFIEKSLPKLKEKNDGLLSMYQYFRGLTFNNSGSVCIYINNARKLIMLNKINGEWFCAMLLLDNSYHRLGLTLDEKNIFVLKTCKDTENDDTSMNLEVMGIEDKLLKSATDPYYKRNNCSITPIKYKNFFPLLEDTFVAKFYIHPSGLALFSYAKEREGSRLNIITPRQLTTKENRNLKLEKIRYYTKKFASFGL